MWAILIFHNCEGQSHKSVSTDHNFWRERRAEADSNRGPSAYQPNALPLGQAGSLIALYRTAHFYTQTSSSSVTESLSYISSSSDTRSCEWLNPLDTWSVKLVSISWHLIAKQKHWDAIRHRRWHWQHTSFIVWNQHCYTTRRVFPGPGSEIDAPFCYCLATGVELVSYDPWSA